MAGKNKGTAKEVILPQHAPRMKADDQLEGLGLRDGFAGVYNAMVHV